MITILVELLLFYIFLVYVLARFIIPNYGWKKSKLPEKLPPFWQQLIKQLNEKSHTKEEFLKNAYEYMVTTYKGGRYKTFIYFFYLFGDPLRHKNGFIQCNVQNYLLRVLLVKSGWFEEDDIRVKTVFLNLFTHQYLQVRVGEEWIDVDPHGYSFGVPFGKKAFLFV